MRLTMLLDMAAGGFGDRVLMGGRETGITAGELARRAVSGAALLKEREDKALLYLAPNGPAFPVALFAASRAGVPLVPLNYRLGSSQLDALLAKYPRALGVADETGLPHLARAGIDALLPDQWLDLTEIGRDAPGEPTDDDPAAIIYTSGTTSEPKGVVLRHSNLVSYVLDSVEFASADPDDAALVSVPPYHIAGVANVITNLYAGRRAFTLDSFDAERWLSTVREQAITQAMVVPTMLARIIEADHDRSIPTLRSLAYGGAPMPSSLIERALAMWPDLDFVNAYGLTETSSTIAVLGPDDHRIAVAAREPDVRARLSSVGRPLPGIDIEIRDADGHPLAAGMPGRIHVRGPQISAEYAGVGRVVDDAGYFDTRDEGYLDEDGFLFIGGRTDDTIIRGAENIAPSEIEDVLLRHPDVLDAAVFGVPDEEWGQRIEAAVVARPGGLTAESLQTYARSLLRSSKTPERFWFFDELPRTVTGKLIRRDVVAQAGTDRAVSTGAS